MDIPPDCCDLLILLQISSFVNCFRRFVIKDLSRIFSILISGEKQPAGKSDGFSGGVQGDFKGSVIFQDRA